MALGRLPPLQSIGRSQRVEAEEPPDLSDTEIDRFLDEYNNKPQVYVYSPDHVTPAVQGLAAHFRVLSPGDHLCKRIPETSSGFTHSPHAVAFSVKYAELRHMLRTQAHLQFVRDYTARINAAAMFVTDLENVVKVEYTTWYNICHETLTAVPSTKLECLGAICEDLRVHMNHWNSVKQLLYTDPWLAELKPSLVLEIHRVRTRLFQLRNTALWWVDRLMQIGFRVLAHCDLERISSSALWDITRGLEEFNSIVTAIKYENVTEFNPEEPMSLSCDSHIKFNSYRSIDESIKPVPFSRVLNLLASERSRYAAAITHDFFANNRELLHIALGRKGLGAYDWAEGRGGRSLRTTRTSDYHTASRSDVSLGTVMLRVGHITAPDLSNEASPLMDFARREKTFAHKFLQIVFNSTKLLKRHIGTPSTAKKPAASPQRSPKLNHQLHRNTTNSTPNLPPRFSKRRKNNNNNEDAADTSSTSLLAAPGHSDPKRKSVSWSDASEVPVTQQLMARYMDALWTFFGTSLLERLSAPAWGSPEDLRGTLGPLLVCDDLVVVTVVRMIQHTCAKDIFPPGAVSALSLMSERVSVITAWRAWDRAQCVALASASTDKCHPVLLEAAEHSSNTARCLRDAYQPLHSTMCTLGAGNGEPLKSTSLTLATQTVHRLIATCDASLSWCDTRGTLYLHGWALGAFLLVTQSDYKILGDELRRSLANCPGLCSPETDGKQTPDARSRQHLGELVERVEGASAQLQALSGTLVRQFSERCHKLAVEFFSDEMPTGKVWKRRQMPDTQLSPAPYVSLALDTLLEPIIAGSSKLAPTSALCVVSMATTALCEAWTEVILTRKLKFSMCGAAQLEADFSLVAVFLEAALPPSPVRQSVLSLDIFRYLAGIVDCLRRQPPGRATSRPPGGRKGGASSGEESSGTTCCFLCCNVSVGTVGSDPWPDTSTTVSALGGPTHPDKTANHNTGDADTANHSSSENETANHSTAEIEALTNQNGDPVAEGGAQFKVPKMEQWLALRLHGGARSWPKLPSCFQNANS